MHIWLIANANRWIVFLFVCFFILDSSPPTSYLNTPKSSQAGGTCCQLTCECLETQCRSTLRTLLVAARRMMNSLSQVFSVVLKPKHRRERYVIRGIAFRQLGHPPTSVCSAYPGSCCARLPLWRWRTPRPETWWPESCPLRVRRSQDNGKAALRLPRKRTTHRRHAWWVCLVPPVCL